MKNSSRSDLSWHLEGHMWPLRSRHLLWSSTVDQGVDDKSHPRSGAQTRRYTQGWIEGYHKLLTWDILSYGVPLRVCHVGAGRVLTLSGILPEASYGFNFHTLFHSPLCSWKSVLICHKSERSIHACLLPQQRGLCSLGPKSPLFLCWRTWLQS